MLNISYSQKKYQYIIKDFNYYNNKDKLKDYNKMKIYYYKVLKI